MIITAWFDFEGERYYVESENQSWSVYHAKSKKLLNMREFDRKGFYDAVIAAKLNAHMPVEVFPVTSEVEVEVSNIPITEMLAEMSVEISLETLAEEQSQIVPAE